MTTPPSTKQLHNFFVVAATLATVLLLAGGGAVTFVGAVVDNVGASSCDAASSPRLGGGGGGGGIIDITATVRAELPSWLSPTGLGAGHRTEVRSHKKGDKANSSDLRFNAHTVRVAADCWSSVIVKRYNTRTRFEPIPSGYRP